jgi:hypothetical protein
MSSIFLISIEALAKRDEEVDIRGASEREADAYSRYAEVLSKRQQSRSAPQ